MMPNCRAASLAFTRSAAIVTSAFVLLVVLDQLAVIHLVDVVAGQDHDVLGPLFFERVDVLIDGVGRALVPLLVDPLLRRHDVDELAQLAAQIIPPAERDVAVEAHRLVLREHENPAQAAVEAVRQREVDDAIDAAKRHRRLGPVARQRPQPRPFPPANTTAKTSFIASDPSLVSIQRSLGDSSAHAIQSRASTQPSAD